MCCTRLVGMHLGYLLKMPRSKTMLIRAHGPMQILNNKNYQCGTMPVHLIGIEFSTPAIPPITAGISGSFYRCLSVAWRTANTALLTGAPSVKRYLLTNKSLLDFVSVVIHRSPRKNWPSGTYGSPIMQTACWQTWISSKVSGRRKFCSCSGTGLVAPRALTSISPLKAETSR